MYNYESKNHYYSLTAVRTFVKNRLLSSIGNNFHIVITHDYTLTIKFNVTYIYIYTLFRRMIL